MSAAQISPLEHLPGSCSVLAPRQGASDCAKAARGSYVPDGWQRLPPLVPACPAVRGDKCPPRALNKVLGEEAPRLGRAFDLGLGEYCLGVPLDLRPC